MKSTPDARSRISRARSVLAIVDGVRRAHPAMQSPVRWEGLQRILARDRITVVRAPIKARAYVDGADGAFVITMRAGLDPRLHTKVLLHEYAHAKLHLAERGEVVRQLLPCLKGDPREDEANLFALLLWLGPSATPDHPDVARLVAKLETRQHLERRPSQIALELTPPKPQPVPTFKPLPEPFEGERAYERKLAKSAAAKMRVFRDAPKGDDFDRILFYDEARGTTRFEDLTGRYWWIYNYQIVDATDGKKLRRVRDFMSGEIDIRMFVRSTGERRAYRFGSRRERRIYRASMLDRQLAEAKALPLKAEPPSSRSSRLGRR